MLEIQLLGRMKISYDGKEIEGQLSTKTIALICLLLIKMDKQLSRDKIIGFLWPDSAEDAARYNLRYNLWLIKKAIPPAESGENFILSEKDCCSINSRYPLFCDLTILQDYKPSSSDSVSKLLEVKQLFRGDVLEGWYLKNCGEFNDTILFERMVFQNKQMEVLERLAALYQEERKFGEALQILKEMASVEPENEAIALNIMQAYVNAGNRVGAINYYKNFETTLWSSLGISPEEDLKKMYHVLMQQRETTAKGQSRADDSVNVTASRTSRLKGEISAGLGYTGESAVSLKVSCPGDIPFFGLSQIVAEILHEFPHEYLLELPEVYWRDLSYIQGEVELHFVKSVPQSVSDVRIADAFCKLMQHIKERAVISIEEAGTSQIDSVSWAVVGYLQSLCPERIKFTKTN